MLDQLLATLGLTDHPRIVPIASGRIKPSAPMHTVESPTSAKPLAHVMLDDAEAYERTISGAVSGFQRWRAVPAPVRGQVVRACADALREHKQALGTLISLEMGKILQEGLGEVQESIDIADYAVGLSRQLPGAVFPSERAHHRMFEQWLPLGPVGVITAFNFPNAVWAWNAMLAAVCGDSVVWKPSLLAPLTAIATHELCARAAASVGHHDVFHLLIGDDDTVARPLTDDRRVPLISATGSCRMGRIVGQRVAQRLGRSLLELGGNNAVIVHHDADIDLALRAVLFSAVGTAGQRCTTTRRLILHRDIADGFLSRLKRAYESVNIGDPLAPATLVGPLINRRAVEAFTAAVAAAREQGGTVVTGGETLSPNGLNGHFVRPTIIRAPSSNNLPISLEETFAPILYVFTYTDLDRAIEANNGVAQGLSSAIFSDSVRVTERFLSPDGSGSDCGLAYVNLGTSGAEIGGAFGGEKDTGGGRESGSDSWKAYMRRQTCTINFSGSLELAQGIRFE